jgi:Protein of unknown function (DUF732)
MIRFAAALLLPIAALIGAAPAHAYTDQDEQNYVAYLSSKGIIPNDLTATDALSSGHAICEVMDKYGYRTTTMLEAESRDDHITLPDAGYVVGAAQATFCPWNEDH